MSEHITTITTTEQPSLIERFNALKERCAQPVIERAEQARADLDSRMIAHIHYRAAELIDVILG